MIEGKMLNGASPLKINQGSYAHFPKINATKFE
jgi:hypothetical protein